MSEPLFTIAPGYDDPLELLLACHGRVEQHYQLLQRLVGHIRDKGVDAEAKTAIARVHKYFNTAAVHHHQDEEEDIFPLLSGVEELLGQLRSEHETLEAQWRQIDSLLQSTDLAKRTQELAQCSDEFARAYARHIELENGQIIPMAKVQLSPAQLKTIGQGMARRRQAIK